MNYCIEGLMPIAKVLLWSSGILGGLNLITAMFFCDEDWRVSEVRREAAFSGAAVVLGIGLGLWDIAGGGAVFAWVAQSMVYTMGLLLVGAGLMLLTAWSLTQMLQNRRMHNWLGEHEKLAANGLSAEALRAENEAIEGRIAANGRVILFAATSITFVLALWIALDGRCDQAPPSITTSMSAASTEE